MNKPYLIVAKDLIGGAYMDKVARTIRFGEPEQFTHPHLAAMPIDGLDIPPGPYLAYPQLGISHDELTLKADRHHPSLRFGAPVYGPVDIVDEPEEVI